MIRLAKYELPFHRASNLTEQMVKSVSLRSALKKMEHTEYIALSVVIFWLCLYFMMLTFVDLSPTYQQSHVPGSLPWYNHYCPSGSIVTTLTYDLVTVLQMKCHNQPDPEKIHAEINVLQIQTTTSSTWRRCNANKKSQHNGGVSRDTKNDRPCWDALIQLFH